MKTQIIYDAICYCVVVLYMILAVLSIGGIRMNRSKRSELLNSGDREKFTRSKGAIAWRFRFFLFLLLAVIGRIVSLVLSLLQQESLRFEKAENKTQAVYQIIASIPSLLFFSSFTAIAWFFAHMAFYKNKGMRRIITPLFATINGMLYISIIILSIVPFVLNNNSSNSKYYLMFEIGNPLYAICDFILSFSFIYFGIKIKNNVKNEEIKYQNARKKSAQFHNSTSNIYNSDININVNNINNNSNNNNNNNAGNSNINSLQIPSNHNNNNMNDNESSYDHSLINPKSQHGVGKEFVAPHMKQKQFFIKRLFTLSILCCICWTIRGIYFMLIRFDTSIDDNSFGIDEKFFESMFYFLLEWPPSIGALLLMLRQPSQSELRKQNNNNNSNYNNDGMNRSFLNSRNNNSNYPNFTSFSSFGNDTPSNPRGGKGTLSMHEPYPQAREERDAQAVSFE